MSFISFSIYILIISIIWFSSLAISQQPYAGKATTNCGRNDNSVLGYTCNGLNKSCQSYLIFRSMPPHNTASTISALFSTNSSQISQINSVSENAVFETNKEVIVPVDCSCSGQYYQANISYVIGNDNTFFSIANNTLQGLSTCQAISDQNANPEGKLFSGETIMVPLRCACPTKKQFEDEGVNYLLSYLVTFGDFVDAVSRRFGVETSLTLEANGLSENDFQIYPFTTLLIPLQNPPSNNDTIVPPLLPPSPAGSDLSPPSRKSSKKTWVFVVIGVLGGVTLLLLVGTTVFWAFFRKSIKKKDKCFIDSKSFESGQGLSSKEFEDSEEFLLSLSSIAKSIKVYRFEELRSATDDFSPACKIENSVYRGTFHGDFGAIKVMNGDVSKEITLLNKISHFNLIRLSGVCFNNGHWYLVYEYASNGSLNRWLYETENNDHKILSWTQRLQIAVDVATGLNYLHSYTVPPLVHKDLQTGNILLDTDFRAKIANFGLARSAEGQDGEFALTRHVVGTTGYMAPEYLENGFISTKLDVYAFGVLMLEMISGKEVGALKMKNVLLDSLNMDDKEDEMSKLKDFVDPSLQENYPIETVVLMVRLIEKCLKKDPRDRPGMDEIVQNLSRMLDTSLNLELSMLNNV